MAILGLSPLRTPGGDIVLGAICFKPNDANTPVNMDTHSVSSVVRAAQGTFTVTLTGTLAAAVGVGVVNKPSGAAQYFARFEHSAGTATATVYLTDELGALTDINLVGGGNVTVLFLGHQNPTAVF